MEAEQAKIAEQTVKDQYDDKSLSESERKTVNDFSEKIDIMESNVILQYGSAAQKKVTDFSDNALKNVRTKDLGEIGGLLSTLVTELKGFNANEEEK
ncbi:MAG: toxic anion resistance protein, partial [Solobacterium sp.]|nr:toxic anion resistance protein [Solobacterium sp.]